MSAISVRQITAHTEDETHVIAAALAKVCVLGDCVLLKGDLGAGKTSFSRGFIRTISTVQRDITSPTFTLVHTYPRVQGGMIFHCDLYRIKHEDELQELGLEDAFSSGITLIEWPEIAAAYVPKNALTVSIAIQDNARLLSFSGIAETWQDRLQNLCKMDDV